MRYFLYHHINRKHQTMLGTPKTMLAQWENNKLTLHSLNGSSFDMDVQEEGIDAGIYRNELKEIGVDKFAKHLL